jgi:Ca2+-binding EF-hand superfamily protein
VQVNADSIIRAYPNLFKHVGETEGRDELLPASPHDDAVERDMVEYDDEEERIEQRVIARTMEMMKKLSEQKLDERIHKKCRAMFDGMDADGDGVLTVPDLQEYYRKSGVEDVSSNKMQKLIEQQFVAVVGRDHDSRITFEQFAEKQLPIMRGVLKKRRASQVQEEEQRVSRMSASQPFSPPAARAVALPADSPKVAPGSPVGSPTGEDKAQDKAQHEKGRKTNKKKTKPEVDPYAEREEAFRRLDDSTVPVKAAPTTITYA